MLGVISNNGLISLSFTFAVDTFEENRFSIAANFLELTELN